ncbi:unnamed protein product [Arctogadus glacialis]
MCKSNREVNTWHQALLIQCQQQQNTDWIFAHVLWTKTANLQAFFFAIIALLILLLSPPCAPPGRCGEPWQQARLDQALVLPNRYKMIVSMEGDERRDRPAEGHFELVV